MSLGLFVVIVLLVAAATAVFWPLRSQYTARRTEPADSALLLARDAKLGEISDLELDYRVGKLSAEDFADLRCALRAEAVEIMRQIDRSHSHPGATVGPPSTRP